MWFWYTARAREIFVDIDSRKAMTRALHVLRRAMARRELYVRSVWLYGSLKPQHAHLIIVLRHPLTLTQRTCWALWMGSDQLRAAYVLERARHVAEDKAELLCSQQRYGFRKPDDVCSCSGKHKPKSVTDKCPALARILGEQRSADYFPRNRDRVERGPLALSWGRVPMVKIKKWKGV